MPHDPWEPVTKTFANARAAHRSAQDRVMAEFRRQAELDAATPQPAYSGDFDRIMAGRVARGGAA